MIFYQSGPIEHDTHVPGPVSQSSAEIDYNAACTAVIDLAHFRMLIHELLNKDPDKVPKEAHLIFLDIKYDMCMAKNGKDTKHTRHIARRMYFVRNGDKCNMHKIEWYEGGLQLADILHTNRFCASFICIHYLQNSLSFKCAWYVWYPYHS